MTTVLPRLNVHTSRDLYWGKLPTGGDDAVYICASFEYLAEKVFQRTNFTMDDANQWFVEYAKNSSGENAKKPYVILTISPEGQQNCIEFLEDEIMRKKIKD